MKKITVLVLILLFLVPVAHCESNFDLSGMSYAELVALKDQINLTIWNSQEWQEVEVPQGVWVVGEDIPAGKWTIKALDKYTVSLEWGDLLDESGTSISFFGNVCEFEHVYSPTYKYYDLDNPTEVTWDLKSGQYLIVENGNAVFTPYAGKPSLGFK